MATAGRKPGRRRGEKRHLGVLLSQLQDVAAQAEAGIEQVPGGVLAITTDIRKIIDDFTVSDAAAIAHEDERLQSYYDGVVKTIGVLMLDTLNRCFTLLNQRLELQGNTMDPGDIAQIAATVGSLMHKLGQKPSNKPAPKTMAELDAAIEERERQLGIKALPSS